MHTYTLDNGKYIFINKELTTVLKNINNEYISILLTHLLIQESQSPNLYLHVSEQTL